MTSATSSSAPASTSTPKPPRSPPLRPPSPDLPGHPPPPPPDPRQPQPPRLRPQPDRLQPALKSSAEVFGSEGAVATALQHFQVANCASLAFAPKLTIRLLRLHQARRQPRHQHDRSPTPAAALRQHRLAPRSSCLPPSSSTTPTSRPLARSRSSSPQATSPANAAAQLRSSASQRPKLPCSKSRSKAPSTSATARHKLPDIVAALNGQIGHRPRRPRRLGPRPPAHHLRNGSRRSRLQFHPPSYGGRKGLTENTEDLCSRPQIAAVTAGCPERQVDRRQPEDPASLQEEAPQARPALPELDAPREGGADDFLSLAACRARFVAPFIRCLL